METKDKIYSVILGIMILSFLIIVGITVAWGLGYIHFGKQVQNNNEVPSEIVDGSDDDISSESVKNSDSETQIQNPSNDNEIKDGEKVDLVQEAYKKYSNFHGVKNAEYTRGVSIENGQVIVNAQEKEIVFENGTPIMATGNAGHAFESVYVLNDNGEVYVNNLYEVNYDYEKHNFKKITFTEKIVDIGFVKNDNNEFVGPYFMTESGKVLNSEGEHYK